MVYLPPKEVAPPEPFEINEDFVAEVMRRPYPYWIVKLPGGEFHVGVPDLSCSLVCPTWQDIPAMLRSALDSRIREMIFFRENIPEPSKVIEGRYLTPDEVAYRYRISPKTVYNAIRAGKLPMVELPAHRMVVTERAAGEWRRRTKVGRPLKSPDLHSSAHDYFLRGEWGLLRKMLDMNLSWNLRKKILMYLKHEDAR